MATSHDTTRMSPKKENGITVRFDDREWIDANTCAAGMERALSDFVRYCVRRYMYGTLRQPGTESHRYNSTESNQSRVVRDFEPSGFGQIGGD